MNWHWVVFAGSLLYSLTAGAAVPREVGQTAFVKGKVAVFIDEGAAAGDDEALKAEGWTVMHFPVEEITDGQTQAEAVAAAVKENVRSKKASKRRAKR